jgi:hypothetical protein
LALAWTSICLIEPEGAFIHKKAVKTDLKIAISAANSETVCKPLNGIKTRTKSGPNGHSTKDTIFLKPQSMK